MHTRSAFTPLRVRAAAAVAGIALVAALLASAHGPARALASISVCEQGCDYATVVAAVEAAEFGDTILIGQGTYVENVVISTSLTLRGLSRETTTIDGGTASYVLYVRSGVALTVENLTISNGRFDTGGGIVNLGALTLRDSLISDNVAVGEQDTFGGGVFNFGGTVDIQSTIFEDNEADYGGAIFTTGDVLVQDGTFRGNIGRLGGGAVYNREGRTIVNASSFEGNRVTVSGYGGAVYNADVVALANSVLADNYAAEFGGGLYQYTGGAYVSNATFSGNEGAYGGGGLYISAGESIVTSTTLYANRGAIGGTLYTNIGELLLSNSIVADSPNANCFGDVISLGHNLDTGNTCRFSEDGDQVNVDVLLDPELAPNGGFSLTHALQQGSPAIDAGDLAGCLDFNGYDLATDQRGYPRSSDGDGDGDPICDLGAYELYPGGGSPPPTATPAPPQGDLTVCASGCDHTSIQAAVDAAAAGDVIGIGPGTFEENVTVGKELTLRGTDAESVVIDGGFQDAAIRVGGTDTVRLEGLTISRSEGVVSAEAPLEIRNAILTLNSSTTHGAVYAGASLLVEKSTVVGNVSLGAGGGIHATGPEVTLRDSVLTGNRSALDGGGMLARGRATLESTTVSGNEGRYGGGIAALDEVTLRGSSVTGNTGSYGGGIYAYDTTTTVQGGSISRNEADVGGGIYSTGSLRLSNAEMTENRASSRLPGAQFGYGAAIFNEGGQVEVQGGRLEGNAAVRGGALYERGETTLDGVVIFRNSATYGGAIFVSSGRTELENSLLTGNLSYADGGAVYLNGGSLEMSGGRVEANDASGDGGGLLLREGSSAVLRGTDVVTNTAYSGGGVASEGDVSVSDARIDANLASGVEIEDEGEFEIVGGYGGALYATAGRIEVRRASLGLNEGRYGGAVATGATGEIGLENVTLAGNVAELAGGAMYHDGGALEVRNATAAGNEADPEQQGGAGLWASKAASLSHTILAEHEFGGSCAGTAPSSEGWNLDEDGSCGLTGTGDQSGIDARLGEYGLNGGPSPNFALAPDSPAVDGGNPAGCVGLDGAPLDEDQRRVERPADGNEDGSVVCDIGAYERNLSATPPPTVTPTRTPTPEVTPTPGTGGGKVHLPWLGKNAESES